MLRIIICYHTEYDMISIKILIHDFHDVCFKRIYNQMVKTSWLQIYSTMTFSKHVGSKYFFMLVAVVDNVVILLSKLQLQLPTMVYSNTLGNE